MKRRRSASGMFIVCTAVVLVLLSAASACGEGDDNTASSNPQEPQPETTDDAANSPDLDEVVDIGGGRGLYVRCSGTGSPTVVMEGGDGDTSDSYAFAEPTLADVTRTCVYDRANLGRSDPASGPRGLDDLVGDLENLLGAADIPGPYVLVGTSGGGYITAGYAAANPSEVAGMVFIDVPAPFRNPPPPIVEETTWNHPTNVEKRDYLRVEKDAWDARKRIGDIPITVVSVKYSAADIRGATFASERAAMSRNVEDQEGWLVLSPSAEQIVVHTGHAVEEEDPELVIDVILDVVKEAR